MGGQYHIEMNTKVINPRGLCPEHYNNKSVKRNNSVVMDCIVVSQAGHNNKRR